MRKFVLLFAGLLLFFFSFSQSWSQDQLDSANTAKDINEITSVEKEAILYINLARLYPQLFARSKSKNIQVLIVMLTTLKNHHTEHLWSRS